MREYAGYDAWNAESDRAHLRAYVIAQVGEVVGSGLWEAARLVRDVESALVLSAAEASELAADWRSLPSRQISLLRRHKNLLTGLDPIIGMVSEADRTVIAGWLAIRNQLP